MLGSIFDITMTKHHSLIIIVKLSANLLKEMGHTSRGACA